MSIEYWVERNRLIKSVFNFTPGVLIPKKNTPNYAESFQLTYFNMNNIFPANGYQ